MWHEHACTGLTRMACMVPCKRSARTPASVLSKQIIGLSQRQRPRGWEWSRPEGGADTGPCSRIGEYPSKGEGVLAAPAPVLHVSAPVRGGAVADARLGLA